MLRGDPVRGDCCPGRRMDRAPGIIGVFLLKPYNPVIVSREDKRQRGVSRPPLALPKLKAPLQPQKCHTVPTRSVAQESLPTTFDPSSSFTQAERFKKKKHCDLFVTLVTLRSRTPKSALEPPLAIGLRVFFSR